MLKNMTHGLLLCLLAFTLLGMGRGAQDESAVAYNNISAAEAKAFMDSGEPHVLLDVRTKEEFQERRIQGAILIPHLEIKERAASDLPDKGALILIYCRSGRRSAMAARELVQMGYTRVYDFGGINDWPYAVVTGGGSAQQ